MDPNNPNYYQYPQGQGQGQYPIQGTSSSSNPPVYGQGQRAPDAMYYPPYAAGMSSFEASMAPYQPGYGATAPGYDLGQGEIHAMPESEIRQMRRKEQNRDAQRKFRNRNKFKIKELQDKLENLTKEVKSLKNNNDDLKTEREDLQEKIQQLTRENDELKSSLGSSPASTADASWWQPTTPEGYSPSSRTGRGSTGY